MSLFTKKLTILQEAVHLNVHSILTFDHILQKLFTNWNLQTKRIESLVSLRLGLNYKLADKENIKLASAIIISAFGMRLLNDSKDKNRHSLFYRTSYPTILLSKSQSLILSMEIDVSKRLALINFFIKTLDLMIEKEICYDTSKVPNYGQFLDMVEGRTASAYVFVFTALKCINQNFKKDLEEWESFGYHFGMMTQLRNDFQGTFLHTRENDLKYNLHSWPIQLAMKNESSASMKLSAMLRRRNSEIRNEEIKSLLWKMNIPNQMSNLMYRHHQVAKAKLEKLSASNDMSFFNELLHHSIKDLEELFKKNIEVHEVPNGFDGSPSMQIRHLLKL